MRFLVDECTGPAVAQWLTRQGHNAFSVFDELPGISDEEVIRRAHDERSINKISVLRNLRSEYEDQLSGRFVVVSQDQVRFSRSHQE